MDENKFSDYFEQAQTYAALLEETPEASSALLELISACQQELSEDSPYAAFLQGEKALFSGAHEQALRYYLQAKGINLFEFFCYRASAVVFQGQGLQEKALQFAEKALKIVKDDPLCLKIIANCSKAAAAPAENHFEEKQAPPAYFQQVAEQYTIPSSSLTFNLQDDTKEPQEKTSTCRLASQLESYKELQPQLIKKYLNVFNTRALPKDHFLSVVSKKKSYQIAKEKNEIINIFSKLNLEKSHDGIFIRWNGQGIVINPGKNFLEACHELQIHLKDITSIIVTQGSVEIFESVKEIYNFNFKINQEASEVHLIHYYFDAKSYQELAGQLKPHYKQERAALHSLELFVDSPEIESVVLGEGVILHYFLTKLQDTYQEKQSNQSSSLGIKLELSSHIEGLEPRCMSLGYLGFCSWSPLLASHLENCDILVAALGYTSENDFNKISYNEDSLGYNGITTLINQLEPQVVICTDFETKDGDIRLEVIQKMRQECDSQTSIVPADQGFYMNLLSFDIACDFSKQMTSLDQIKIIKPSQAFEKLQYISMSHCL